MLKCTCFLLIIGACVASQDYNSILSRLFNKRTKHASPLILVLDRNTLRPLQDDRSNYNEVALESSDENADSLQYLLQQLAKKRSSKNNGQQRYRTDQYRPSQRDRHQEYNDKTRSSNRVEKSDDIKAQSVLRSPIYKSLLTLRNSLRCSARSECQDECGENYTGRKKTKCEVKCVKKFTCDEPTKCDECEASEEDCGNSQECQGSTKGIVDEPGSVGCKRC